VTGGDVTTTYTYGVNGVATETTAGSTITYTYDASGNLTGAV
jgi:YD repeat-containing protein